MRREKRVARGRQGRPRSSSADIKVVFSGPISPAAFIEALRAERAKIDAAIAAVEALA